MGWFLGGNQSPGRVLVGGARQLGHRWQVDYGESEDGAGFKSIWCVGATLAVLALCVVDWGLAMVGEILNFSALRRCSQVSVVEYYMDRSYWFDGILRIFVLSGLVYQVG